ncbi:MAG: hypothetical protein AB1489_21820 [Acidobacteriota bacterium]
MGLREKRLIKTAQEELMPRYQSQLKSIIGHEIPLEAEWDSFVNDATALERLEDWVLQPLTKAFSKICVDQLGKDAVKEGIKKIIFKNVASSSDNQLFLHDGIVRITCAWGYGSYYSEDAIQESIERAL